MVHVHVFVCVCVHVCAAHISHQRLLFDDMYSQVGNCFVAAIIYIYINMSEVLHLSCHSQCKQLSTQEYIAMVPLYVPLSRALAS